MFVSLISMLVATSLLAMPALAQDKMKKGEKAVNLSKN